MLANMFCKVWEQVIGGKWELWAMSHWAWNKIKRGRGEIHKSRARVGLNVTIIGEIGEPD